MAVLGMGAVITVHGQGKILFSNYFSSSSPKVTWGGGTPPTLQGLAVGSEFNAELAFYVGISASDVPTSTLQMTLAPTIICAFGLATPSNSPENADGGVYAGWFAGSVFQVPGVTPANHDFVSFEVLAFEGSSFEGAAISGLSSIFQSPTSATSASPLPSFVQGSWQNFSIEEIPEPGTLTLTDLGGLASLVMLRRKKA